MKVYVKYEKPIPTQKLWEKLFEAKRGTAYLLANLWVDHYNQHAGYTKARLLPSYHGSKEFLTILIEVI